MMTISPFIENSRLVNKNSSRLTVVASQVADVMISKRGLVHSVVFLPLDYHIKNPQYLTQKLEKVLAEAREARVYVIALNELTEGAKIAGEIQSICLRKNVNMMVCFNI